MLRLIRLPTGLTARLQRLLTNHATPIDLGRDGFEPALFISGRGIEDHGSTDGLRRILCGDNLGRLGLVDRRGSDFGRAQGEGQGAALVIDGDAIPINVVAADHETVSGLVKP